MNYRERDSSQQNPVEDSGCLDRSQRRVSIIRGDVAVDAKERDNSQYLKSETVHNLIQQPLSSALNILILDLAVSTKNRKAVTRGTSASATA